MKKETLLSRLFNYFRPSFEGEDGRFSYKRASTFIFVLMMVKLALFRIANKYEYYTFLTFAILYAVQSSVITVAQLLKFWKGYNENNPVGVQDLRCDHFERTDEVVD